MSKKYCYIDFEFNGTKNEYLNLVCAAYICMDGSSVHAKGKVWLHDQNMALFRSDMEEFSDDGFIFVAYAVVAEARSFISLDLDPTDFKWIDQFLEHRCLTNHNHKMQFGKQLIDGKIHNTWPPKPKWQKVDGEKGSLEPRQNLSAACFKFLGIKIDTKEKNEVRDIIIRSDREEIEENKDRIMEYCMSDVIHLPALFAAMCKEYKRLLPRKEIKTLKSEMLYRGEYAARTAKMEKIGYPINKGHTKSLSDSIPSIIIDLQRDINSQFEFKPFRWDKREGKFKWAQKETREYLREIYPDYIKKWMKTDGKDLSLSLDAFTRFFNFSHDYPRDNFGAQIVRFLKNTSNLRGFTKSKDPTKTTFWDYVGPDDRVRPYFNIYRAQSSRSQPKANGFIFLKPAWMRSLVSPPKGKAILEIDWSQQEFLIGALLSGDKKMLEAYNSGDFYLHFAKLAKGIPMDGTKQSHPEERQAFKNTALAVQYLMTKWGLAIKISQDTGKPCSEDEAQDLIDMFDDVFHVFAAWRQEQIDQYDIKGYIKLADGWYMFGDNQNHRSVANCPVQGHGAVTMRAGVVNAQEDDLDVIKTLHDALFIEFDSDDLSCIDTLSEAMDSAFRNSFPKAIRHLANCRMDYHIWSNDYPSEEDEIITESGLKVKRQKIFIDDRSRNEYNKFQTYFTRNEELELL